MRKREMKITLKNYCNDGVNYKVYISIRFDCKTNVALFYHSIYIDYMNLNI